MEVKLTPLKIYIVVVSHTSSNCKSRTDDVPVSFEPTVGGGKADSSKIYIVVISHTSSKYKSCT